MTKKHKSTSAAPVAGQPGDVRGPLLGMVGIGASAGGLDALEQFFRRIPPRSGIAFIVVQHLDPDKESSLAPLLQRASTIPVQVVSDATPLKPDHCYVAPPGVEVSVLNEVLYLFKPVTARGHGLPIDTLLRSLAQDHSVRSAGVVLSGMGSDGLHGARALKEASGLVLAQQPETAKFASMPRSVIEANLADIIAPPGDMPARLMAYFAHPLVQAPLDEGISSSANVALEKVLLLVRDQTGHDFTFYKKGTVYRRIQRRMAIHQLGTVEDYVDYLRQNEPEAELLYKELLIGVTAFFRNPEVWHDVKNELAAGVMQRSPDGVALRAWVTACSTGEEAYTLAITFTEALDQIERPTRMSLQIFATDLDNDSVSRARSGFYPESIAADVSEERLGRFFSKEPGGYRVNKDIRSMVVFAQQSIASDPPFARLDILTCRNLLIYLEPELQKRLMPLFHHSLRPGGMLVLGSAETTGQFSDLFAPLSPKTRIYRRLDAPGKKMHAAMPIHSAIALQARQPGTMVRKEPAAAPSLQTLADQVLVRNYAPSAVLATAQGDIVYFSGKTGKYLEPASGKANLNLFAMARPGLSPALNEIFYRAVRQKEAGSIDGVTVSIDGKPHSFKVTVEPMQEPEALRGLVMVVFSDINSDLPAVDKTARPAAISSTNHEERLLDLSRELARSRDENQTTREEMQIAQESLLSANEELQSANEELTTSREEMQSINEELQTVNAELQARVDALARASDDMENLLNSTGIATLFLDQHLNVRRFTTRATGLIKLIPGDVGRPITDIVSEMNYAELPDDAREVLRTLIFKEKEVSATEGRWFLVRTMPYRTQDNRIDGVVITFADISIAKKLEATLRDQMGGGKLGAIN